MLDLTPATFEEFEREARRGNVVPVMRSVLGYDAARWFEPALNSNGAQSGNGFDAVWMFFRTVLAFDRVRQLMEITSIVFTDEAGGDRDRLRDLYARAVLETKQIEKSLSEGAPGAPSAKERSGESTGHFQSNWPLEDFERAVGAIKERIAAGDCYQVVIAQQFTKPTPAPPLAIYRALRATNPSPYMYFLRLDDDAIIGASPEMLVRSHGQRLDYRPIAGTRKRGATEAEDWMLGEEMRNDEKEVAEHTMLVDLGRNDLGR